MFKIQWDVLHKPSVHLRDMIHVLFKFIYYNESMIAITSPKYVFLEATLAWLLNDNW